MSRFLHRHPTAVSLAAVVLLGAAVRMPFWLSYTHAYGHGDAIIWEVWSRSIYEHGFLNVLRTADSNNIGYHYVLWPTSAIYGRISPEYELWTAPIRILIKIPPFVCDLGLIALLFAVARGLTPAGDARRDMKAALAAAAFGLAPATIYDSMWWSQIDSVITLCMLGALVLLARQHAGWAWALWMVGFLIKPQPLVILPALAAFTYWRFGWRDLAWGAAAAGVTALAALAPFLLHGDAGRVVDTYQRMFEQDPIDLAQGAWNGWSILDLRGDPHPADAAVSLAGFDLSYATLTLVLSVLATVVVLVWLRRHLDLAGLLAASAVLVFTFYIVPTSTHERYLYPAFALAAPLLVRTPRLIPLYAMLATTFFLNLLAINPPNASTVWEWHGTPFAVAVASFNTIVYLGVMLYVAASIITGQSSPTPPSAAGIPERAVDVTVGS
jgi:hypothetical protein